MTNKNRKSYLQLKRSLIEFFTAPVRYIKESNTKESAFEKPYLDSEYRPMHFDIPNPDWPTWKFDTDVPQARRLPPPSPFPVERNPDDDEEQGRCDCCFSVWWGECDNEALNGGMRYPSNTDLPYDPSTHYWTIEGAYTNFRQYEPYPGGLGPAAAHAAYFDFDPELTGADGFAFVTLCYVIEGYCKHCVDYWAPCVVIECPPLVVFEFDDDSTPDTIAPGGNITVYVTGGSAPYSWGAAGTGFTWASGVTTDPENVLTSASGD